MTHGKTWKFNSVRPICSMAERSDIISMNQSAGSIAVSRHLTRRRLLVLGSGACALAGICPAAAVTRVDITQGTVQPMPIALPDFLAGAQPESDVARNVTGVITNNLARSGLFAPIDPRAFTE